MAIHPNKTYIGCVMEKNPDISPSGNASDDFDIVVIGGGLTGQAAALALSAKSYKIALVSGPPAAADGRTVALMPESLDFLNSLGMGTLLDQQGAPLIRLRLIDDSGSLFRPPSVLFHAKELGLDAFAINIENSRLDQGLSEKVKEKNNITAISDRFEDSLIESAGRLVKLASGRVLTTRLLIAADGRNSKTRAALKIGTTTNAYDQVAVTAIFEHSRSHEDCSTEFHTRTGPFTLVPLPDRHSSLVWLTKPAQGQSLIEKDETEFSKICEQQTQSILGRMHLAGQRSLVPMARLQVEQINAERAVLIGDAAHAFPPIGAQGLNLGLRDAADLAKCLADQTLSGLNDPGAATLCTAYAHSRKDDISLRLQGVDMLNRSLLSPYLPLDFLRGAGLLALSSVTPLRRFVMQQSIGRAKLPRWMGG